MISLDSYYTPSEISEKMISVVKDTEVPFIADFSVGNGALLKAGQRKWPNSKFIGLDISSEAIKLLRKEKPEWQTATCDFLEEYSRNRSKLLNRIKGKVSLVLLNPPFSCKGAARYRVKLNNMELYSSLAVAFVINSIPFLAKNGKIVAILPAGSLHSEKDKLAWYYLAKLGKIEIIGTNGYKSFSGCHAHTVIMQFLYTECENIFLQHSEYRDVSTTSNGGGVSIFRGKIQMHSINNKRPKKWLPLIHSTELIRNRIDIYKNKISADNKAVSGPVVLIPRVGEPNKSKVSLYLEEQPIVLSDCVIALQCSSKKDARRIHSLLISNWHLLKRAYNGTCAKYLTLKGLTQLLFSIGIDVATKSDN